MLSSIFMKIIPLIFLSLIVIVPKDIEDEFNIALKAKNPIEIEAAKYLLPLNYQYSNVFEEKMKWRFRIFNLFAISINILCCYYAIAFCAIYSYTSWNWLIGCLISLVLDLFIYQTFKVLLLAFLRQGADKYYLIK